MIHLGKMFFSIQGMTCASCVNRVEKRIAKVEGVKLVNVNLAAQQATVETDFNVVNPEQIINAVEKIGYKADLMEENNVKDRSEEQEQETKCSEKIK